jgi:hypothetical protein
VSSDIEVFIEHHRELDPSNSDQLCSQLTTYALVSCHHFYVLHHYSLSKLHLCCFCQNKYGEEMMRLHRERVNWRQQDIDPMTLYASGGGKSHGRLVDSSILIIYLYNVVIYYCVIHVECMPY